MPVPSGVVPSIVTLAKRSTGAAALRSRRHEVPNRRQRREKQTLPPLPMPSSSLLAMAGHASISLLELRPARLATCYAAAASFSHRAVGNAGTLYAHQHRDLHHSDHLSTMGEPSGLPDRVAPARTKNPSEHRAVAACLFCEPTFHPRSSHRPHNLDPSIRIEPCH
jgi:hypothetical protein